MTIAFSIKRMRSSSGVLREDLEPSSPCKLNFLKPSEHQRRSSLSAIFQYCFRISTNEQQKHSSAFENDALFERYRYRQQQKRAPTYAAPPPFADANTRLRPKGDEDDGGDNEPPPRVVCRPEEKRAASILINKHHRHRHTSSLQNTTAPPMASHQHHRRSRTATHIRQFSASNIATHSEDLTAKEFADIAGIKILPDDVDTTEHQQQQQQQPVLPAVSTNTSGVIDDLSNTSHILLPHYASSRHRHHPSGITINTTTMTTATTNTTYSSGVTTPLARESSSSSAGDEKQPHIWDDAFWRNPDRGGDTGYFQSRQQRQEPQTNAEGNNTDDNLPPVLLEMRHRKSFVIKRGRFEVHLHQTTSTAAS